MNKELEQQAREWYEAEERKRLASVLDTNGDPMFDEETISVASAANARSLAPRLAAFAAHLEAQSKPMHQLSLSDACRVWNLLPEWVRLHQPGMDPTFYGTLSAEGDAKVRADMVRILGIARIPVAHVNAEANVSEETICAIRDMLVKAYIFEQASLQ